MTRVAAWSENPSTKADNGARRSVRGNNAAVAAT